MSPPGGRRLSRSAGHGRPRAPVRLVHLGLGSFFRAHQAWYTEHAADAPGWGYAAFGGRTGRDGGIAAALAAQDGLYTVVTRAGGGDGFEVVSSVSEAHGGDDHEAWLARFASPALVAVTVTVTEAGYRRRPGGGLDGDDPGVRADVAALRRDLSAAVATAPGRLVAGLAARLRAGGGVLSLVPCDNVPGNGAVVGEVVHGLAAAVDPGLDRELETALAVVSTVVDRITPHPTPADVVAVREATGLDDRAPVVTEPFHEWVLSGPFPAGRPAWEAAGAIFTDDVTPYEQRKLLLLNGAHSLLAYGGSLRGHRRVPDALADETCRGWLDEWWAEATAHLAATWPAGGDPAASLEAYRASLAERFANTRLGDRLERIAADGSQKLPLRILPVLAGERAAGRVPAGAVRVLAAWVCHLRGFGVPVDDVRADGLVPLASGPLAGAVPRILASLDPRLGDDAELVAAVAAEAAELAGRDLP